MSSQDVTVSSSIITLDVIHSDFDPHAFIDYAKSASKKAMIFLNASEFSETSGRMSRNEPRSTPRQSLGRVVSSYRAVKTRIDNEIAKTLDLKRRQLAHDQKRSSRTGIHRDKSPEPPAVFGGLVDLVFCLVGFREKRD
jgi:hypothetical protein